jgi:hypothetical protein
VADGVILWASAVGDEHFSGSILWMPSAIESIASESLSENSGLKSVVFRNS